MQRNDGLSTRAIPRRSAAAHAPRMTQPIRLYRFPLSGHSHRVELFLSLLSLPCERIDVDIPKGAHKRPEFLEKNAFGQIPVIEDGDLTLADSNAILVYLSLRYDAAGSWYPREPARAGAVQRWLSAAAGPLAFGPGALRVAAVFKKPLERERPEQLAAQLLSVMERELGTQPFLVGDHPTIADVALYTYTAHAPEGGVSLAPYPAVRAWIARFEALPGFIPMVRIPVTAKEA